MGVYDQAARYAAQAEQEAVLARLLRGQGVALRFREWADTRTTPLPGGRDRTADRVAILTDDAAPEQPWLLVQEFQAQYDPDKLEVTLAEAAQLRLGVRHGEDRRGKYKVLAGLVYLRGWRPENVLDMTLPGGLGTRHAPLIWNIEGDTASEALECLAAGQSSWGILFWLPLMQGGCEPETIKRWRELAQAVPDRRMRADLAQIALVFAELAGCFLAWEKGLEKWEMTESMVVNRWIEKAEREKELETSRAFLIRLLNQRFPGQVPPELVETINQQPSLSMLQDWFDQAVAVRSIEDFSAVVRR